MEGGCSSKTKMRNLRARVRLLLPDNTCRHYQDRNVRIEKLQTKREKSAKTRRDKNLKGEWSKSTQRSCGWYHQKSQPPHIFSQFHKLTKSQLEQISDDKQYFMGEEFVEGFRQYFSKQNDHPNHRKSGLAKHQTKPCRIAPQTNAPPVVPLQELTSNHLAKQAIRQQAAKDRFESSEQVRALKMMQKEGMIEAKLLKAWNKREQLQTKQYLSREIRSNKRSSLQLRTQRLNMKSERTDIVRLTAELKRVCAFRRNIQKEAD